MVDDELLTLLERNYSLSGIDSAHVAGRRATMVAASRAGRVAARWWVDEATGLVLWQETYDEDGDVELSFGFTTVTISPSAEMLDHLLPRLAGSTATTSLTTSQRIRAQSLRLVLPDARSPGSPWSGCAATAPTIPTRCIWSTATG